MDIVCEKEKGGNNIAKYKGGEAHSMIEISLDAASALFGVGTLGLALIGSPFAILTGILTLATHYGASLVNRKINRSR